MGDARSQASRRRFYVAAGLLMVVIVVAGFWPGYFRPLLSLSAERSAVIHVHAAVYVGWFALFITQAALAATGRIKQHRQVGRAGIAYGVLVFFVGLATTLYQYAGEIRTNGLEQSLGYPIWPLIDMLIFAPLFGLAVAFRHKPEIHKRLMIVAMTTLLIAPAGRLPLSLWQIYLVWFSPILLGLVCDLLKHRVVHPVYLMGLAVLYLSSYRPRLIRTEVWPEFARWLGSFFI